MQGYHICTDEKEDTKNGKQSVMFLMHAVSCARPDRSSRQQFTSANTVAVKIYKTVTVSV